MGAQGRREAGRGLLCGAVRDGAGRRPGGEAPAQEFLPLRWPWPNTDTSHPGFKSLPITEIFQNS